VHEHGNTILFKAKVGFNAIKSPTPMFVTHGSMAFEFTRMHDAIFLVDYIIKYELESPFVTHP
jgi:hypothetical protein